MRGMVGLLRHDTVARGEAAIRARIDALRADGVRIAVADAIDDDALRALAAACAELPLVTGRLGRRVGAAGSVRGTRLVVPDSATAALPAVGGAAGGAGGVVLGRHQRAGAALAAAGRPARRIDPLALAAGERAVDAGARLGARAHGRRAVLVYATAPRSGGRGGAGRSSARHAPGQLVERAFAASPPALVEPACAGWSWPAARLPGAVVQALDVRAVAHRRADRPRRAVDAGSKAAPLLPGVEVGQLRQRGLLRQGVGAGSGMSRAASKTNVAARAAHRLEARDAPCERDLPRRPLAVRARLRACDGGQHQRACADDGFLITPTDACLGFLEPGAAGDRRCGGRAALGRPRQQDARAAPAHLRRTTRRHAA